MSTPLHFNEGSLQCPQCSGRSTHLVDVIVSAHEEGGPPTKHVGVNPRTGEVREPEYAPTGSVGEGKRDRTSLVFTCEECPNAFAVIFTQHKGDTIVDAVRVGVQ